MRTNERASERARRRERRARRRRTRRRVMSRDVASALDVDDGAAATRWRCANPAWTPHPRASVATSRLGRRDRDRDVDDDDDDVHRARARARAPTTRPSLRSRHVDARCARERRARRLGRRRRDDADVASVLRDEDARRDRGRRRTRARVLRVRVRGRERGVARVGRGIAGDAVSVARVPAHGVDVVARGGDAAIAARTMRDRGRRRDGFARTRREPFARRRARGDEGVVRRRCHGARLREDVAAIRRRRRQARRRRRAQHGRRGRDARGEDFRDRIRCERLGVDARGIGFDRYRRGERDEGAPGDGRARRRETDDVRVARGCVSLVRDARRRDEKSAFGVVIAAFAVARDGRRRVDVARRLARHRAVLAIVVRRAVQTLSRRKGAEAACCSPGTIV